MEEKEEQEKGRRGRRREEGKDEKGASVTKKRMKNWRESTFSQQVKGYSCLGQGVRRTLCTYLLFELDYGSSEAV